MPDYRSKTSTAGRNMAGARALWRATGMKDDDFSKPIIAVVNSFTQFGVQRLQLLKLAYVFDGDDRLSRKAFDKTYVVFSEGQNLPPVERECSHRLRPGK